MSTKLQKPVALFGKMYACSPDRPSYITTDGVEVWMWRKGQKVRFYTKAGVQVGPEQSNVYPAVCAAAKAYWYDPARSPTFNFGLWVEAGLRERIVYA